LIIPSYCFHCKKVRRMATDCWSTHVSGLGPATVPIENGGAATAHLYTPKTALGWVVDGHCLQCGVSKRMVVPRAWAERRKETVA